MVEEQEEEDNVDKKEKEREEREMKDSNIIEFNISDVQLFNLNVNILK